MCIVFKGRSLFLRLLKLAFFPTRKSETAFSKSHISGFERRFIMHLKLFSFWSPTSAAIKTARFRSAIFSQNHAMSSVSGLSSTLTAFASLKPFINNSLKVSSSLEIASLCSSQSALHIFSSTLCRFPV